MNRTITVADALAELRRAEAGIAEAQSARDAAQTTLEETLAAIGWRRLIGGFSPGATPLFVNDLYPDAVLDVDKIIRVLDHQRRAAA